MTSYRDERDALRARVDELERQLEEARDPPGDSEVTTSSARAPWVPRLMGVPARVELKRELPSGQTEAERCATLARLAVILGARSVEGLGPSTLAWKSSQKPTYARPVWFARVDEDPSRLVAGFEHRGGVALVATFLTLAAIALILLVAVGSWLKTLGMGLYLAVMGLVMRWRYGQLARRRREQLEAALDEALTGSEPTAAADGGPRARIDQRVTIGTAKRQTEDAREQVAQEEEQHALEELVEEDLADHALLVEVAPAETPHEP